MFKVKPKLFHHNFYYQMYPSMYEQNVVNCQNTIQLPIKAWTDDLAELHLALKANKDGNVLFNDTRNTFYLQLYGIRHKQKDHSETERRNPLLPLYWLVFTIRDLYTYHPTHRLVHTTTCYTSCGAMAGMRNSWMGPQWGIHMTTHHILS